MKAVPRPSADLTVNLTVSDDANSDFLERVLEGSGKTVTVNANQATATYYVRTKDNINDEANGRVTVTVNKGLGYNIGSQASASVMVNDNDPTTVTLAAPDASAVEGSGTNKASIKLTLSRGLMKGEALEIPLRFTGGSVGTDFSLACPGALPRGVTCSNLGNSNAAVTFTGPGSGASATEVTITLSAPEDQDTSDSIVTVSIPSSSTGNGPKLTATGLGSRTTGSREGDGQIVFADNDISRPTITISGGSAVTEGTPAAFTVKASPRPSADLTVNLTVSDDANSDFLAAGTEGGETVTINANQSAAAFNVATVNDSGAGADEPNGKVRVIVNNARDYKVGANGSDSVSVNDDDATTVTLAGAPGNVAEGKTKAITVTLGRGLVRGETLTAPLTFAGTAAQNTDYTLAGTQASGITYANLNGTGAQVVFTGPNSGTTAAVATITLTASADSTVESTPETVSIALGTLTHSGLGGGADGTDNLADFSIEDPPKSCSTVNEPWKEDFFCPSGNFRHRCADPSTAFDKTATVQGTRRDENNWLRSWSHEIYLWYDEIADRDPECCTTPEYFDLMKTTGTNSSGNPKDRFHFSRSTAQWQLLSQGVEAGYGAVFRILRRTAPRKVLVLYTEPNSPATAAGVNLLRGTEILEIDGIDLVNTEDAAEIAALNSALNPSSGDSHTFTVKDPGTSSQKRSVTMTAGAVTLSPVQKVKVITTSGGDRVGYMLFNDHISTAAQPLVNAVNTFVGGDGIDDLVLDLRYNPGGVVSIAQLVASMVAGSAGNGKTFTRIEHNDKRQDNIYPFISSLNSVTLPTLDLPRLFVLTGTGTCSASELIINSLLGIDIDVIVIGSSTCGKYHGFRPRDNCGTTYFSIEFRVVNDRGTADYDDGFSPDCSVSDNDFEHQLGDPEESLLKTALAYQADGACSSSGSARIQGAAVRSSREEGLSIDTPPATRFAPPGLILD